MRSRLWQASVIGFRQYIGFAMNRFLTALYASARGLPLPIALALAASVLATLAPAPLAGFSVAQAQENSDPSASATASPSAKGAFSGLGDKVHFSGFARLVGGYLDDKHAIYQGYDDSIGFGEHSLFALQTDVDFSAKLSFTAQLLAHSSSTRDSGLEWAYLTYRPSQRWQFKGGKLRTPFLIYSDIIDVGFTYPWVIPPQQVYSPYMAANFTGLSAAYQFNIQDWGIAAEAYWGDFDGDITVDTTRIDTKFDNLQGLILEVNRGNLHMRASYHHGHVDAELPRLYSFKQRLRQAGFARSARSLIPKGDSTFAQAAISYSELDYFLKAEWIHIASDTLAIPEFDSYYLSGGYTFYPSFTAHATFSELSAKTPRPVDEIPAGVAPPLDALRSAYIEVFNRSTRNDNLQSLSVGLRWDLNPSLALKAEWIHLNGDRDQRSFFTFDPAREFDRKANLLLFALEWIF